VLLIGDCNTKDENKPLHINDILLEKNSKKLGILVVVVFFWWGGVSIVSLACV
jgi:hypothetical protein